MKKAKRVLLKVLLIPQNNVKEPMFSFISSSGKIIAGVYWCCLSEKKLICGKFINKLHWFARVATSNVHHRLLEIRRKITEWNKILTFNETNTLRPDLTIKAFFIILIVK